MVVPYFLEINPQMNGDCTHSLWANYHYCCETFPTDLVVVALTPNVPRAVDVTARAVEATATTLVTVGVVSPAAPGPGSGSVRAMVTETGAMDRPHPTAV